MCDWTCSWMFPLWFLPVLPRVHRVLWGIPLQSWKIGLHRGSPVSPCFVCPYLPQPHCRAIKKRSLWNNLAWWALPAPSIPMSPLSLTTNHHRAPLLLTLSLIFLLEISFFDEILEISLVFTHGITLAWVNRNRCFVKKNAYWCSVQCTRILLVII